MTTKQRNSLVSTAKNAFASVFNRRRTIGRPIVDVRAEDSTPKTFDILAYTGGKLHVDGFDLPVVVDLNGLEADGEIPITIKHDTSDDMIIGQATECENDGKTLRLFGDVTADPELSPRVKRVFAMANKKHKWQASIGARVEEEQDIPAGKTISVNGQQLTGPFTLAVKSVLRETAVTGMGADKKTTVSFAACAVVNLKAEDTVAPEDEGDGFEAWVKDDLGLDPGALTEKARGVLAQQYAAETRDKNTEVDAEATDKELDKTEDVDDDAEKKEKKMDATGRTKLKADAGATDLEAQLATRRKSFAAQLRREAKIEALCGTDKVLFATAIEKGWDETKTELESIKRKDRTIHAAPFGHVRSTSPADTMQALQGGLLLRAGGRIDHPGFAGEMGMALELPQWLRAGINTDQRQKVMEAAHPFRDMSMVDLCRIASSLPPSKLAAAGWDSHVDGSNKGFIRAAVSGGQLADIFTTNINALLIQKLLEEGDTTAGWTRESDAMNFQPMERTRLLKGSKLSKHARGKAADHVSRSDLMETYKIARYSEQFKVDEMDIIDDRFQAIQDIPNEMGLACARLRPDLVYAILFANANLATGQALFSATQPGGVNGATQSNLNTGSALASATLQAGMAGMFNMMEGGVGVNVYPTHILVPMVLAGLAFNLLQGQNIALAGTAGTVTERGDINPLAALQQKFGKVEVVSDQRLTNGVVDPASGTLYSGSSTTWRLLSNKAPTIEVAYLRGSGRAPQVRQYILDKGEWGMGWDVNLDIGAKALSFMGLQENRA